MERKFLWMDERLQKRILTIGLLAYAILMIIGAIIPNPGDVPGFAGNTKYFHFAGFIVFAFMALKIFELFRFKQAYILSVISSIFFIFLTESLQLLVATRHFLYTDMLIDASGCAIGFIIYGVYRWISSRQ